MTILPFACAAAPKGQLTRPAAPSAAAPLRTCLRDANTVAILLITTSAQTAGSGLDAGKDDAVRSRPGSVHLVADPGDLPSGPIGNLRHQTLLGRDAHVHIH